MKNIGKIFEQQFQKSVPEYSLAHRMPDPAQSFGSNSKLRFSNKNPFDYMLFNPKSRILYALELKTVKGKSISFERTKEDKGDIHYYQINGLNDWNKYDWVICGFIIEFRELEKTIFLQIDEFNSLAEKIDKKSFTLDDLHKIGISYILIDQTKKIKWYTYDIEKMLKDSEFYGGKKNV